MVTASAVLAANQPEFELEVGSHAIGDLSVLSFEADEGLSLPFEVVTTTAPAPGLDVDAASLVGEPACLHVLLGGADARYFDGIVTAVRAWEEGAGEARRRIRLTIRPKLWRLSKRINSRIFQGLTAPDIVKQVLREGDIEHRFALTATYVPRIYCVQYRESDLDFVSRLLEDEGIFWFFEHAQGKHVLVLSDHANVHEPIHGQHRLPFREASRMVSGADHVDGFTYAREMRPGKVTVRDYDPRLPALDITGTASGDAEMELEVYDYPAGYQEIGQGRSRAKLRLEAERAQAALHGGTSPCRTLVPGAWFELEDHAIGELNRDYLLVSVSHRGQQHEALGGIATMFAAKEDSYHNDFVCLRKDVPWRTPSRTPRPVIPGPQTALVVGPPGEEIFTDEQGRIKVQFHWDREGQKDDRSSCWLRVAQAWAGPGWGALYLPRIGHEVVVEFLEGDPDRPIVTGSVYNGANPPPVSLPGEKTRSTLRSASTPGSEGSNELRFEDAKGQEEIYLHAQRDVSIVVENDRTEQIGRDESLTVGRDRTRNVGRDQRLEVGRDDTTTIGGDQVLEVVVDRTTTVGRNHTETVARDQSSKVAGSQNVSVALAASEAVGLAKSLAVGGAYTVTVGGAMNELVGAIKAEEVGGDKIETVGAKKVETVAGSSALNVGADFVETVGGNRTLKVGKDLTIHVGGNARDGVTGTYTLKAKEIIVQADDKFTLRVGSATLEASKSGEVVLKGGAVQVTAAGPLVLKGASISEN